MKLSKYLRSPFLHILIIFLLALSVRLVYLQEIRSNPFFENLTLDQNSYDRWAIRIAKGDWLGKEIFYQDPLYPYFLGALYRMIGRDLFWARVVQAIFGSLTCALIYLLGKSLHSKRAGIVAGLIAAIYNPFIYFDAMILKTFLGVFLTCLLLVLLLTARSRRSFLLWIFTGIILGFLALVRANVLLMAGGALAWLFLIDREHEKASYRLIASAGFLAGLFVVVSLVFARNYVVGKDYVLLTSQAGQNFYIGNNPHNRGGRYEPPIFIRPNPRYEQEDFRVRAEIATGRAMKPSELSSYWFGESFKFIKTEPAKWLMLMAKKFWRFWNWYEVPDNQNIYFFSRYSALQRLPLPNFQVVAALGLTGMLIFIPRWRRYFILYMTVFLYSFSVIAFYVFERYRLPVVPPLIIFGAFLISDAIDWGAARKWGRIALAAALLGVFLFLLGTDVDRNDYYGDSANAYCRLGGIYEKTKDLDAALAAYQQAIEIMPHYWAAYYGLGQVYSRQGKDDLALENYFRARTYNPGNPDICARLGFLYYKKRDLENAIKFYRFAAELKPDWNKPYYWLATIYKEQGNEERAEIYARKLRELKIMDEGVF